MIYYFLLFSLFCINFESCNSFESSLKIINEEMLLNSVEEEINIDEETLTASEDETSESDDDAENEDEMDKNLKDTLIEAIKTGNLLTIHILFNTYPEIINIEWEDNGEVFNPLAYAVSLGKIQTVYRLLSYGASVNVAVNDVPIILFTNSIQDRTCKRMMIDLILDKSINFAATMIYFYIACINDADHESAEDLLLVAKKYNFLHAIFIWQGEYCTFFSLARIYENIHLMNFIASISQ